MLRGYFVVEAILSRGYFVLVAILYEAILSEAILYEAILSEAILYKIRHCFIHLDYVNLLDVPYSP